jgi:O-antigen/teichoic acid export membrane protein
MSSISSRLFKGSVWLSAARVVINALALLSTILLARLLVPDDFGIVSLATTILIVVSSVTELSLSLALVRQPFITDEHLDTAWTLNALRGLILAMLFAAAGHPIAALYGDQRLVAVMVVLALSLLLNGLTNPRTAMLQRQLVFWQEFVLSVAQKLASFIVSVSIAYFYRTYWALVIGTLAMQATNVLISYAILPYRPRISLARTKELLSFSIWLTGSAIVNTLNWRFDFLFIGRALGMSALGHYTVGNNLAQIPTRETTGPLAQVVFPGFSTIRKNPSRLSAAYQRAQALVTAVALPAGFIAALIADPLIHLAMGDRWEPVIFVVQVLACVFALQTLGSLSEPLGMAVGQTRLLFIRNLQMLFIRIPIIVTGMMLAGLQGVVIGRVISGLIATYLSMRLVRQFIGVSLARQIAVNVRALVSVAVMVGGVALINPLLTHDSDAAALALKVMMTAFVAFLLYCGTSLLLWSLMHRPSGPEEEIRVLIAKAWTKVRTA